MKSYDHEYPKEEALYDFSTALDELKKGKKIARKWWNGKGMYLLLQKPTLESKMSLPYIYMCIPHYIDCKWIQETEYIQRVPWIASQTDLLETDWIILD